MPERRRSAGPATLNGGDQGGIVGQEPALIREAVEQHGSVADQVGRGLVAGEKEEECKAEQLRPL